MASNAALCMHMHILRCLVTHLTNRLKKGRKTSDLGPISLSLTHCNYVIDNDVYYGCMHVNKTMQGSIYAFELRKRKLTNSINSGFSIGKPPRRSIREVNPIRQIISPSQRLKLVVVPIINQGITKNEVAWHLWSSMNPTPQTKNHNQCQHGCSCET